MQTKGSERSGAFRRVGAVAMIAATLGFGGCLAGTIPAPIQPGADALPAANLRAREDLAIAQLQMLSSAQAAHLAIEGKYGTVPELIKQGTINSAFQGGRSYTIDVTVLDDGARYVAMAVPVEYGPTGRRSFYLDQSGVIRGGDHEGGAPRPDDPPVGAP